MKKEVVLLLSFVLVCFVIISFVSAQENQSASWDYLAQQWNNLLAQNPFVHTIDSFFSNFSFVFMILFGEPYSVSILLLFVIILWIYVLLTVEGSLLRGFGFSSLASFGIGLAVTVIIAQLHIYRSIVVFVGKFVLLQENAGARAILIVCVIGIIVLFFYLSSLLSKYLAGTKRGREAAETRLNQKKLEKITNRL